jgi:hypothetical protein
VRVVWSPVICSWVKVKRSHGRECGGTISHRSAASCFYESAGVLRSIDWTTRRSRRKVR